MTLALRDLRIGYVPYDRSLRQPGDRRRFVHYATRRGLRFEIAEPDASYDLVVLSARADISAWARMPRSGTRIVYDLIDSYLALPAVHPKNALRGIAKYVSGEISRPAVSYRHAIQAMCRRADGVICSTDEQRADLRPLCANVHVILDVHRDLISARKRDYSVGSTLNLVWEGLPVNLGAFAALAPALAEFGGRHPFAMHLVTDLEHMKYMGRYGRQSTLTTARRLFRQVYLYEWNDAMLSPIATACDLALIPLDLDDPLARGKPENKLLLFWRMGVPALVSDTPAYSRAMAACDLQMTCRTPADWVTSLTRYAEDEQARREAGDRGHAFAEHEHAESQVLERWDRVFESVLR